MYINDNTIAIIRKDENGYLLRLFKNRVVIFAKHYDTMRAAKIAQARLIRKYNL